MEGIVGKKRKHDESIEDGEDLLEDESYDSTNSKLFKIERKIGTHDMSKRQRRLLQNRKSALKCRLKKMGELDTMKYEVDELSQ